MQAGTKSQEQAVSNTEIDNLSAMRLSQEPWRWRKAVLTAKVSPGAKVAAFAVLEFVNRKSGRCFASLQTIANTCGMTERGIRAAVLSLREAGLVRVVRRGCKRTNLIYLAIPVTVTAASGDRHGGDKVTVTAMTPNLREEPLRENLPDKPSSELLQSPACQIVSFEEGIRDTEKAVGIADSYIRRANDDHAAYCRITHAALDMLGRVDTAKLPDGRYLDRLIWEAIPKEIASEMVRKARNGTLKRSEVAEVVRGLPLPRGAQRAA